MGLFGRKEDTTFHRLLEEQANAAVRASEAFQIMIGDLASVAEHARKIKEIEHEGDTLRHQLANRVDSTFVTPLDKEDLNALSSRLDDVTDAIESASGRLALYQLYEPREDLPALAACLAEAVTATHETVAALRGLKGREALKEVFLRVHNAENAGDSRYRQALAELLNAPGADPILVLKWKEIYDRIEQAIDACEEVADLVEGVSIKYA